MIKRQKALLPCTKLGHRPNRCLIRPNQVSPLAVVPGHDYKSMTFVLYSRAYESIDDRATSSKFRVVERPPCERTFCTKLFNGYEKEIYGSVKLGMYYNIRRSMCVYRKQMLDAWNILETFDIYIKSIFLNIVCLFNVFEELGDDKSLRNHVSAINGSE